MNEIEELERRIDKLIDKGQNEKAAALIKELEALRKRHEPHGS